MIRTCGGVGGEESRGSSLSRLAQLDYGDEMTTSSRKDHVRRVLAPDENAGRIVRGFAELEWNLELLLTRYFATQERFNEFNEILMGRFTMRQKIELLRRMTLPRRMRARDNAVSSLEKLLFLRNIVAHSSFATDEDCERLASDNEIWRALEQFPKSFNLEVRNVKNRLTSLESSYRARARRRSRVAS